MAENIGVALHIMDLIAERREELFPELRKIVVDYEVVIANSRLTLSTTSATLPKLDSATKGRVGMPCQSEAARSVEPLARPAAGELGRYTRRCPVFSIVS